MSMDTSNKKRVQIVVNGHVYKRRTTTLTETITKLLEENSRKTNEYSSQGQIKRRILKFH